jgi:rod shape-determining protein MreD
MRSMQEPGISPIFFTLFLGLILIMVPWPLPALMPDWLLLILLYWTMARPALVNVGVAWVLGIITDLALGSALGSHALIYTVMVYCVVKFLPRMVTLPVWQQSMIIFILVMLDSALQYWIMSSAGIEPQSWTYWLPAFSSMMVWPLLCWLLKRNSV